MAKSKNRGRKITKRKRRQNYTKRRRRQLGRGLTSSKQSSQPPKMNNTNALKKSLFDIPVYENGKQTERTTTLDATLIDRTNDPFIRQDDEEFKPYAGPSYPGSNKSIILRNTNDREREEKRIRDKKNRESLQAYSKLYGNSQQNTPEWMKKELDEYLKSEGK